MTGERTIQLHLSERAHIGDLFRIARVAAGMRPRDAANALGLTLKTYTATEAGRRKPRTSEIVAFASITGQHVDFFEAAEDTAPPGRTELAAAAAG